MNARIYIIFMLIITAMLNSMEKSLQLKSGLEQEKVAREEFLSKAGPESYLGKLPAELRREISLFAEDAVLRSKIKDVIQKAGNTPDDIFNDYAYLRNEELKKYVNQYPAIVGQILAEKFTQKDLNQALKRALDLSTVNFNNVKALIFAGSNPNTKNLIGQTALEFAVRPKASKTLFPEEYKSKPSNLIEFIKLLITHGANVNEFFYGKTTPLYEAVMERNEELVRMLLEAGANVYKKYKKGQFELESPLELVKDEEDFPDKNNPIRKMIEEAALKQKPE